MNYAMNVYLLTRIGSYLKVKPYQHVSGVEYDTPLGMVVMARSEARARELANALVNPQPKSMYADDAYLDMNRVECELIGRNSHAAEHIVLVDEHYG